MAHKLYVQNKLWASSWDLELIEQYDNFLIHKDSVAVLLTLCIKQEDQYLLCCMSTFWSGFYFAMWHTEPCGCQKEATIRLYDSVTIILLTKCQNCTMPNGHFISMVYKKRGHRWPLQKTCFNKDNNLRVGETKHYLLSSRNYIHDNNAFDFKVLIKWYRIMQLYFLSSALMFYKIEYCEQ